MGRNWPSSTSYWPPARWVNRGGRVAPTDSPALEPQLRAAVTDNQQYEESSLRLDISLNATSCQSEFWLAFELSAGWYS